MFDRSNSCDTMTTGVDRTMYACICHQITEKELEETMELSHGNVNEAVRKLNLGGSCGICLIDALEKVAAKSPAKDSKKQ